MQKIILTLTILFCIGTFSIASAATKEELKETVKVFINLKGHLCANVVDISPLQIENVYEVRCVEYRGGTGTVDYLFNAKTGEVVKR